VADVRVFRRAGRMPPVTEAAAPDADAPVAFEEIFFRFGKPVASFIRSMIGERALAEDLTQETFVRAFQNIQSRRAQTRISTWLFGIAYNVVREAVRQKYRGLRSVAAEESALESLRDRRPRADDRMIAVELIRKVQAAIDALPEDHRTAFVLKMVQRLPYGEISDITGASVGKLKSDLHRARLEMRRRLQPYFGEHLFNLRGEP